MSADKPFYFAWIDLDSDDTVPAFDPEVHAVKGERCYRMSIKHSEGQKPLLEIDIRNPGVGLLASSQAQWAVVSYDTGDSDGIVPLFMGRVLGIQAGMIGAMITLRFVADPPDYAEQKQAVARALKVAPYYDPLFLDEKKRDDAAAILQGYSADWHVDRVTLEVSTSDYIQAEDGVLEFLESDILAGTLDVHPAEAPLSGVEVHMDIPWTQTHVGGVDFGTRTFSFLNGDGFLSDWPKTGASLAGGWKVLNGTAVDLLGTSTRENTRWESHYKNQTKSRELFNDEIISIDVSYNGPRGSLPGQGIEVQTDQAIKPSNVEKGTGESIHISQTRMVVGDWAVRTTLELGYDAKQGRAEHASFTLLSDIQPMIGGSAPVEKLDLNLADVGEPVLQYDGLTGALIEDSDPEVPIVDTSRRSYLPTDRGLDSLAYGIARARALLAKRSRAVEITFQIPFRPALSVGLSCRKSARVYDRRLPGGQAVGKIVAYELVGDGSTGALSATITIQCAIGYGNAITTSEGTNDYIDDDYIDDGYFYSTGTMVAVGAGDVAYSLPEDGATDGEFVFPLTKEQVVISEVIHTGLSDPDDPDLIEAGSYGLPPTTGQQLVRNAGLTDQITRSEIVQKQVEAQIRASGAYYELTLKPLTGSHGVEYGINVSHLVLPKQIDLEAAA